MNTIKTIDLWTERLENHLECFCGAFIDGFENGNIPFDSYKVIRNCNCVITSNINISNKHNAIVFYKESIPVRLMVINKNTNLDKCIEVALNQPFNLMPLRDLYSNLSIKREDVDLNQLPIFNKVNLSEELDVGSCDRPSLLASMLEGSYTENDTGYGKDDINCHFNFVPNLYIQYDLLTNQERFNIEHHCAFVNDDMTRVIPLQDNSSLDIEEICNQYKETQNHL